MINNAKKNYDIKHNSLIKGGSYDMRLTFYQCMVLFDIAGSTPNHFSKELGECVDSLQGIGKKLKIKINK